MRIVVLPRKVDEGFEVCREYSVAIVCVVQTLVNRYMVSGSGLNDLVLTLLSKRKKE
jgi:hypothetical protein